MKTNDLAKSLAGLAAITVCLLLSFAGTIQAETHVGDPRCEYLNNPLGIDTPNPRLSWVMTSDQRGEKQTGYQVLVASSAEALAKDQGDLWDSGNVDSDQSILVPYAGKELTSRQQCFWKVRVWDGRGQASPWSEPASWSMGLLKPEDWQAKWIGLDPKREPSPLDSAQWIWFPEGEPATSAPAGIRYFRRSFALPSDRTIAKAMLNLGADEGCEVWVNGKKAGTGKLLNLDIAPLLQSGTNILAIAAANARPSPAGLIASLRVEYSEGAPEIINSDAQWKCHSEKVKNWEAAALDETGWTRAKALGAYGMAPWGDFILTEGRRLPARYLRKEFEVEKKIARATVSVCGLGFFDLHVNGKRVSDQLMNPALSDYRKAAYYLTFDITDSLKSGRNALGVVLGNGRFFAPRLHTPAPTVHYGNPQLRLQTDITYQDGTSQQIVSDDTWTVTDKGPIRANNEYDGEEYDARMEMPGWDQVGFDETKWSKAELVKTSTTVLLAQMMEPMRVTEVLKPIAITSPKPGVTIVEFGQNIYGTVRLKASAPQGTEVRMVSAYSLLPDGTLKTADNRRAKATEVYTFKGDGVETWSPRFKGQGFRRIQVTGFPGTPTADNFEGLVIHTDSKPVGEFTCSNELINRIHLAQRWGMRMYLRSAPLDPDRDERQAWLGDPAKDAESEAFNFNVATFYAKWMDDVRRSQRGNGTIPDISMNWAWGSGVEWPSVFTIIPDWFVDFYGDQRVVATQYEAMKQWVEAIRQLNQQPDGTIKGGPYGDWCDAATMDGKCSDGGSTSRSLIATAYHYNNYRIMERAAKRLNKPEDAKFFAEQADRLRTIFNNAFFDPATNTYQSKTQCAYLLPLTFGLVPEEHKQAVIAKLVEDIMVKNEGHLSVGLIGMQWLMQTLTDCGHPEVAWTIASQTTRPSWGYMISKGATTIWERWDCDTRGPGMNSEALLIQAGNLDAWFYQTLAGINYDRQQPGFKNIILRPYPVGDLTWVKAHLDSSYGRIASHWERKGDHFTWNITVPANTTATVYVPAKDAAAVTESGKPASKAEGVRFVRMEKDRAVFEVVSGSYRFEAKSAFPPATSINQ